MPYIKIKKSLDNRPKNMIYLFHSIIQVRMNAMTQTVVLCAIRMSDARMFPSGVLVVAVL